MGKPPTQRKRFRGASTFRRRLAKLHYDLKRNCSHRSYPLCRLVHRTRVCTPAHKDCAAAQLPQPLCCPPSPGPGGSHGSSKPCSRSPQPTCTELTWLCPKRPRSLIMELRPRHAASLTVVQTSNSAGAADNKASPRNTDMAEHSTC